MKRLLNVGVAVALLLSAQAVYACSCAAPPPPKKALEQAAAVFVAKVTAIENVEFGRVVTMEISTTWKGTKQKIVTVHTGQGGGDCGYGFVKDESYLVYAYQRTNEDGSLGPLRTSICSRTRPLAKARFDMKTLGPAMMPPL